MARKLAQDKVNLAAVRALVTLADEELQALFDEHSLNAIDRDNSRQLAWECLIAAAKLICPSTVEVELKWKK